MVPPLAAAGFAPEGQPWHHTWWRRALLPKAAPPPKAAPFPVAAGLPAGLYPGRADALAAMEHGIELKAVRQRFPFRLPQVFQQRSNHLRRGIIVADLDAGKPRNQIFAQVLVVRPDDTDIPRDLDAVIMQPADQPGGKIVVWTLHRRDAGALRQQPRRRATPGLQSRLASSLNQQFALPAGRTMLLHEIMDQPALRGLRVSRILNVDDAPVPQLVQCLQRLLQTRQVSLVKDDNPRTTLHVGRRADDDHRAMPFAERRRVWPELLVGVQIGDHAVIAALQHLLEHLRRVLRGQEGKQDEAVAILVKHPLQGVKEIGHLAAVVIARDDQRDLPRTALPQRGREEVAVVAHAMRDLQHPLARLLLHACKIAQGLAHCRVAQACFLGDIVDGDVPAHAFPFVAASAQYIA